MKYFRRLSRASGPVDAGDGVHYLNPRERAALKRVERGAILRAAAAGAISTIVSASVEVAAHPLLGPHPRHATLEQTVRFYAVVAAATILASALEIMFLYWDALRAVHLLAREAGLDLFPDEDDDVALAGAMARAALELPNPNGTWFGVDPHREASRARLVVASLVYKAKISVTNFVMKALVRRTLGRAMVRTWLPFVAVPFTAAWNATVCWLVVREARIRAMGPSAAHEMIDLVFAGAPELSENARAAALRAVASSIVRTSDMHPNLLALLREVMARTSLGPKSTRDPRTRIAAPDGGGDLDDTRAFLARLASLEPVEQRIVLRVLTVSAILDGRLTRAERRLLEEARAACGLPVTLEAAARLRRAFLAGDAIDPELIASA